MWYRRVILRQRSLSVRELHVSQKPIGTSRMGGEHDRWYLWPVESQHMQYDLGQLLQCERLLRFRAIGLWPRMVSFAFNRNVASADVDD
jgi:hypothetical protein